MRKSAMLAIVLLILICFGKVGKSILVNSIVEETAVEAKRIETYESDISFQAVEEQETDLSRNTLLEETIAQTTEPDSLTTKTSTGRILTNELCVGLAKEIYDATNDERIAAGLDPLIWDDELAKCANIRAEECITNFSHIRPDGTKCYVLSDLIWGENIAKSPPQSSGYEYVEHWMTSEGHKANILQSQYTMIGVGVFYVEEGSTAVQLFGIDAIE